MSIYLYARTDNDACRTSLINVPLDSFNRLDYIEDQAREEFPSDTVNVHETWWYDEFMKRVKEDPDLVKAEKFRVSGWGFFNEDYLNSDDHDCHVGHITDKELARKIFDSAQNKELSNHLDFEQIFQLSNGLFYG